MTLEISLLRVVVVNFWLLYAANGESNLEREREREFITWALHTTALFT